MFSCYKAPRKYSSVKQFALSSLAKHISGCWQDAMSTRSSFLDSATVPSTPNGTVQNVTGKKHKRLFFLAY